MPLHLLPSDHQHHHHHHHPLRPLTPHTKKKTYSKKLDPPLPKPEGSGFATRKLEGSWFCWPTQRRKNERERESCQRRKKAETHPLPIYKPTTDLETQRRSRELPERVKILRRIREQEEERVERKREKRKRELKNIFFMQFS